MINKPEDELQSIAEVAVRVRLTFFSYSFRPRGERFRLFEIRHRENGAETSSLLLIHFPLYLGKRLALPMGRLGAGKKKKKE